MAAVLAMDPVRWQQIERLYQAALARPAVERAAFLAEACAGDDALRQEVAALLDAPATAEGVFGAPALAVLAAGGDERPALRGDRLGVYQLKERIGAGRMGEVYRARDTRLGRDVAIKILPRAFTDDPERLARFEREARVLAALNHPNIATIHGIEESDGIRGLVMELVDGETLEARLRRPRRSHDIGRLQIPVNDALLVCGVDRVHDLSGTAWPAVPHPSRRAHGPCTRRQPPAIGRIARPKSRGQRGNPLSGACNFRRRLRVAGVSQCQCLR